MSRKGNVLWLSAGAIALAAVVALGAWTWYRLPDVAVTRIIDEIGLVCEARTATPPTPPLVCTTKTPTPE